MAIACTHHIVLLVLSRVKRVISVMTVYHMCLSLDLKTCYSLEADLCHVIISMILEEIYLSCWTWPSGSSSWSWLWHCVCSSFKNFKDAV